MSSLQKYFDPETLAHIQPLGLRAMTLVEGLMAGLHRSPLRGQSIEFAQHREYAAGDDLRQVDWKVFAKSDRYYVKQYEDETNLVCYPMIDVSESMAYRGASAPMSKFDYAQLIACAIAFVVINQQDSSGLITFSDGVEQWLPATNASHIFEDFVRVLEDTAPRRPTDLEAVLKEVVQRLPRPVMLILITDALERGTAWYDALKMARFAGHDLIVVQVLDQDEIQFPFDRRTRFVGLEGLPEAVTDPAMIAAAYRRAMAQEMEGLRRACLQTEADFYRATTNQSLVQFLPDLLAQRLLRRGSG
ncbi:MAG: DUF58 domain-containing protein [Planctomycetota bacterium]|nr:MAG: DUF58 domain-containing protein [Planctomycetota bacterium]